MGPGMSDPFQKVLVGGKAIGHQGLIGFGLGKPGLEGLAKDLPSPGGLLPKEVQDYPDANNLGMRLLATGTGPRPMLGSDLGEAGLIGSWIVGGVVLLGVPKEAVGDLLDPFFQGIGATGWGLLADGGHHSRLGIPAVGLGKDPPNVVLWWGIRGGWGRNPPTGKEVQGGFDRGLVPDPQWAKAIVVQGSDPSWAVSWAYRWRGSTVAWSTYQ